jgi:hypothetical protein
VVRTLDEPEPRLAETAAESFGLILDPAQQRAYFDRLLEQSVLPHRQAIAELIHDGSAVAVVLHEVTPRAEEAARRLGWDGAAPVFRLSEKAREAMARGSEGDGARVTAAWLRSSRPGRILVMANDGASWLLNFTPEAGFSLEPGTAETLT